MKLVYVNTSSRFIINRDDYGKLVISDLSLLKGSIPFGLRFFIFDEDTGNVYLGSNLNEPSNEYNVHLRNPRLLELY